VAQQPNNSSVAPYPLAGDLSPAPATREMTHTRPVEPENYEHLCLTRLWMGGAVKVASWDIDSLEQHPEVWLVMEWAMLAEFVYQQGRKLFRTARGREVAIDPLATWQAAFEALLELGVIDLDGNGPPGARPSTARSPIWSCSPTWPATPSRSARCWSGCGGKRKSFSPSIPATPI
jgi:hypothetical protein